jgi:hypothetical protein
MSNECQWDPVLRWLLFLPAGIVGTVLVQALLRFGQWLNGSGAWWGDFLAAAAEPWAFLALALWVLPRFHRTFTLIFAIPYCCFEAFVLVWSFMHSYTPWRDGSEAAVALASGIGTAIYFFRDYSSRRQTSPPNTALDR